MSDKKRYIITAVTLGLIAAVSGGLIGLVNLLTKNQIIQNEKNKINAGISEIFADEIEEIAIDKEEEISGYKYVNTIYSLSNTDVVAFRTTGSNMYGKISLLVGYHNYANSTDPIFSGLVMIVDEQTYATTLEENYIDPLNKDERDLSDVSCGATYGAKLVRAMVEEAKELTRILTMTDKGANNG